MKGSAPLERGSSLRTVTGIMAEPDEIADAVLRPGREEARWGTGNVIAAAGGLAI